MRRRMLINLVMMSDIFVMISGFIIAAYISPNLNQYESSMSLWSFTKTHTSPHSIFVIFTTAYIWYILSKNRDLYRSRRLSTFHEEIFDIVICSSLTTAAVCTLGYFFDIEVINNRFFILIFWSSCNFLIITNRTIIRYGLKKSRRNHRNLRFAVIIGTSDRAIDFSRSISQKVELGYKILGFVDDCIVNEKKFRAENYTLISNFNNFQEFLHQNVVDEIIIFSPFRSYYDAISQIISTAEELGIIIRFQVSPFPIKKNKLIIDYFNNEAVATLTPKRLDSDGLLIKRVLDIMLSTIAIVIFSPFFILLPLFIKLNSSGPVFYSQQRLGINKRVFQVYKFRSMVANADLLFDSIKEQNELDGPAFKLKNDPRITSFGRFLRRTSLDELPQLFNVLQGNMSLVGPRPLPVENYEGFTDDWHRRRFSVPPGLTCLWQISGRSNLSFNQWMKLDMEYIDNWSIWLDFMILIKTVPAVIRGVGAS